ncbi:hypothetical protein Anas_12192 [Armadillidium nasatum]|uniref:Uncharacterized protein n=1 Tax=Armadillidium nasatum TaxID=96803 RepID=A0A5N5T3M6_9CRUS|nr:hypothetical protein Anas_12192 [Armadillidium nasatum]
MCILFKVSVTPERTIREQKVSRSPQVTRKIRGVTPPLVDNHHHHHHLQKSPSTKAPSSATKIPTPPVKTPSAPTKPTSTPSQKPSNIPIPTKIQTKDVGANKFVSTVVWYPELEPEFNSTKVKLSPEDDATRCIDQILVKEFDSYIKKKFPHSEDNEFKLEEPIYTKHVTTNNLISDFESSLMQSVKASIS